MDGSVLGKPGPLDVGDTLKDNECALLHAFSWLAVVRNLDRAEILAIRKGICFFLSHCLG